MDYYVYMLFNKDTKEVFYVGKGQGYRIYEHKQNTLKKETTESEKEKRIEKLLAEDPPKLGELIVGRFETESEAFAVESVLINWMYGFSNLTNLISGHNAFYIRGKGDFSERKGIDIERKSSLNDGSYTEDQRKKIVNNNIEEKLLNLQRLCQELLGDSYIVSDPDLSVPQDPTVYIHRDGWPARIRLKLGLAGKKLSPAFMALADKDSDSFIEFLTGKGVSPNFGGYPYTLWKNYVKDTNSSFGGETQCKPSINDNDEIIDLINSMVKTLDAELTSPE